MLQVSPDTLAVMITRPETVVGAYRALGGSSAASAGMVQTQLGSAFSSLSGAGCFAAFASAVAYQVAPGGASDPASMQATLGELLAAQAFNYLDFCNTSALLSLIGSPGLIPPDAPAGSAPKATLHFLVWLDSVPLGIGAHAQLVVANVLDAAYLLLDPTYAYALRVPFTGAGPQASLSVIENAATMLQTPIDPSNLAVINPAGTSSAPQLLAAIISGSVGPQYIDSGANGGAAWDANLSQAIGNLS